MPNYQHGKIYKIVSKHTDVCYVGSTTQELIRRLKRHQNDYKWKLTTIKKYNHSSFNIIKFEDNHIMLLENYPCNNRKELELRERYYIEKLNSCNRNLPTRTRKEYLCDSKDKIKLQKKGYRYNNKEIINKKCRELSYYKNSWCGDPRYHNNLLLISLDIFK